MEDTVALNAIPPTYDELQVQLAAAIQMTMSLKAALQTKNDLLNKQAAEKEALLAPLIDYIADALYMNAKFTDTVGNIVVDTLSNREGTDIIEDIVEGALDSLSIEITNRRR
jgi:hypothetical protein